MSDQKPKFFARQSDFRAWLKSNHDKKTEQWVGYYKKDSGEPSITWPESVDEALCFGWIDGIRKSIDDVSYKIRFTPRRPRSHWSTVNIRRVKELTKRGLMRPSGMEAFKKRTKEKSARSSHEQGKLEIDPNLTPAIKANKKAWMYFQRLTPSLRKMSLWWVMSAKRKETRDKRLSQLIHSSERGQLIPPLKWSASAKKSG